MATHSLHPTHALLMVVLGLWFGTAQAGWQDTLKGILGGGEQESATEAPAPAKETTAASTPDSQTMTRAVVDALQVGVRRAIDTLGQKGGFLDNRAVRIPLPPELRQIESMLRRLGQDRYADDFIRSMNRAAEQAVPQTTNILLDTIKGMSIKDAREIIQGEPNAATQHFRNNTSDRLAEVIRPVVAENMNKVGVTSYYKQFVSKASFVESYVGEEALDLDGYVTQRTLDGLFLKLAEEEKKIREQPVARSTDILRQVFGYFDK